MRKIWNVIVQLVCGLWLGGLVALFIFVVTLFHKDHAIAVQAAPQMFQAFEVYQFFLAAVAILSAMICRRPIVAVLFVLAGICALVTHFGLTPQILEMARLGQTHTEEFGKVHGEAMMVYLADTVFVFVAGVLLALKPRD